MIRQVRGALLALHLLAITAMALPAPGSGALDRASWADPTVQAEVRAWSQRLSRVGWVVEPNRLEAGAWAVASTVGGLRGMILAPLQPYYRYFGTWQSWRMFVAPHRFPTTTSLEVELDGAFVAVFVEGDPERAWRAGLLGHERSRSLLFRLGWERYAAWREHFLAWFAREAAEEWPEATRARLRVTRRATPSPRALAAGAWPPAEPVAELVRRIKR
jgi:hypothetical protein